MLNVKDISDKQWTDWSEDFAAQEEVKRRKIEELYKQIEELSNED